MQRAFVLPPRGQIGPITPEQRQKLIQGSILYGHYEHGVDRESAYELLTDKAKQDAASKQTTADEKRAAKDSTVQE